MKTYRQRNSTLQVFYLYFDYMAKDRKEIQAANVDLKLSRIKRLVFPDD